MLKQIITTDIHYNTLASLAFLYLLTIYELLTDLDERHSLFCFQQMAVYSVSLRFNRLINPDKNCF